MTSAPPAELVAVGGRPLTAKGRATRQRIVETASRLMLEVGVERATIDDIQRVAGVNTSQLYHYFADKNALILAVIDHQTQTVLDIHRSSLERVEGFDGLVAWRDMIVDVLQAQQCVGGCPIGSLASDLVETDLVARKALQGRSRHGRASSVTGCRPCATAASCHRASTSSARRSLCSRPSRAGSSSVRPAATRMRCARP